MSPFFKILKENLTSISEEREFLLLMWDQLIKTEEKFRRDGNILKVNLKIMPQT